MNKQPYMTRRLVATSAILAALLLTGCAGTREGTYAAHGADLASTGVGLALGAAEANPLGVVGIPIKIAITEHIKTLPEDDQPQAYSALSAVTWGAVGNNACVIAGLATGGVLTPVCIAVGVGTGMTFWKASEKERNRKWLLSWCAEWVKQGPEYTCDLGKQ